MNELIRMTALEFLNHRRQEQGKKKKKSEGFEEILKEEMKKEPSQPTKAR